MINKPDIKSKIEEQKPQLIKRLIADFKIPILEITVDKNSIHSFNGTFYIKISDQTTIPIHYIYSNKKFSWNLNSIQKKVNETWRDIYISYKNEIFTPILDELKLDEGQIDNTTCGVNNSLYIYIKNKIEPITIQCCFEKKWVIKQDSKKV